MLKTNSLSTCLILVMLSAAQGQQAAPKIITVEQFLKKPNTSAAHQQRQFWNDELDLQIKELHEVCNLSQAQKKKLSVARKGAVSRALEKWSKQQQQKSSRGFIGLQDLDPLSPVLAHKERLWVKAIEKVLTPEQKRALKKHRKQQQLLRRKLAVDEYVVNIDSLLRLDSKQRKKIAKLVDNTYGDEFLRDKNASHATTQVLQLSALPEKDLKEILTEKQMQKFRESAGWVRFLVLPVGDLPKRPILGIHLMNGERGVVIRGVIPDSPADNAGMLAGDVVQSVDNQKVTTIQEVIDVIQKKNAGQEVVLNNLREDTPMEVTAKLVFHQEILLKD